MICAKTKQWGNSIGVIIPRDLVNELKIRPDEEICLEITSRKTNVLKELYGSLKFRKQTSQLLKEARQGMESKYF
jgi:antitoxin component of MazEF toxin-antitoxin module